VPDDERFAALLEALITGGRAGHVRGIVSGYFANAAQVRAAAALVREVKAARPDCIYLCDPVIGDSGRLYVAADIAAAVRDELIPLADVATPNVFECAWLLGESFSPDADPAPVAVLARQLSPPTVLVTSAPALLHGHVGNLLVDADSAILFEHPHLATEANGTGDLLAALIIARHLQGHGWPKAAVLALASVFEVLAGTASAGGDELLLPQFQQALVQAQAAIAVRRLTNKPSERG
jgi:pyridoxine kinase